MTGVQTCALPISGVTIPNGEKALIAWNGSDFVQIASSIIDLTSEVTGTLPVANGGTGVTTSTGTTNVVLSNSPTLVTPILGTPQSVTLTNATGLPLTTGVTGILPIANGGTATATPALVAGSNVTITGTWPNQTINAAAPGVGTVTSVGGTGTVNGITLTGTVTSTGNLTLGGTLSGVDLASQVTGTLPIANGGTGITTTPSNGQIPIGNGTGYTAATLTAGDNVTITNSAGGITIAASGGGGGGIGGNGGNGSRSGYSATGGAGGPGGYYDPGLDGTPEPYAGGGGGGGGTVGHGT